LENSGTIFVNKLSEDDHIQRYYQGGK